MVGAIAGKRIVWNAVGIFRHDRRSHHGGGPAGCRLVIHRGHSAAVSEGHAQDLRRGGARTIEAHVVGPRADHLDGLADCLRSEGCRYYIIALQASAESTTEQV